MENLDAIGVQEKYRRAEEHVNSLNDNLLNFARLMWVLFKSFLDFLPLAFVSILKALLGESPKSVRDQLALGEFFDKKLFGFSMESPEFPVTGAANGLGKEIAIQLAKEGCRLAIVDLDYETAKSVAEDISKNYGVEARAFKTDVGDVNSIKTLKKEVESELGFVDILVNNAGLMPLVSLREGSERDIRKIFDVNLMSHFWVIISKF
jgi:hypothetical protein